MLAHPRDFIAKRPAPAIPANDGKQTPFRGYPVFGAQHATVLPNLRFAVAGTHTEPTKILGDQGVFNPLILLASSARFERATPRLGIWCSILLSYEDTAPIRARFRKRSTGESSSAAGRNRNSGASN